MRVHPRFPSLGSLDCTSGSAIDNMHICVYTYIRYAIKRIAIESEFIMTNDVIARLIEVDINLESEANAEVIDCHRIVEISEDLENIIIDNSDETYETIDRRKLQAVICKLKQKLYDVVCLADNIRCEIEVEPNTSIDKISDKANSIICISDLANEFQKKQ